MRISKVLKTPIVSGAGLLLGIILAVTCVHAQETGILDSTFSEDVSLIRGELTTLKVYNMTRVSIADPDIADIADANDQEILLVGQRPGETALFIWDDQGKRTLMVYVYNKNLDLLEDRAKRFLKTADIIGLKVAKSEKEGKIVISGELPEDKKNLYDDLLVLLEEDVMDLVQEEVIEDLVQIDMQITELSTTLTKSLGIDWSTGGISGLAPQYQEGVPEFDGSISDFFKIGDFTRTGQLVAAVNALVTEGKGRILSKPKLVVISGEEARFLVGGEIPIRTTTFSDSGSSQENIEFKEYGISMMITPTIKRNDKIDVQLNVEVSDIDASTATTVSEDIAFATRSASTRLYMDDGQTIVLAGLIKHLENETMSKIPFLGDLPVFGLLFRSRVNPVPEKDEELVIALTPRIMRQKESVAAQEKQGSDRGYVPAGPSMRYPRPGPAPYYLGIPKEMTGYVSDVQRKISEAIAYPNEAKMYGWEGTVKLGMLILNDGTLAFALVKESSGHDVFDEVALDTTRRLAPFAAFPPDTDLQELNVTIPIVYSLKSH